MLYDDIQECPILVFQKVIETGDVSHLGDGSERQCQEAFKKLNKQIIDEFGLPELHQLIFYKQREIALLQIQTVITDDESYLTELQIAERRLESLKKRIQQPEDIKKLHARNHRILTAWSKRDSRTLTVFEYYNDLKDYEADAEKISI